VGYYPVYTVYSYGTAKCTNCKFKVGYTKTDPFDRSSTNFHWTSIVLNLIFSCLFIGGKPVFITRDFRNWGVMAVVVQVRLYHNKLLIFEWKYQENRIMSDILASVYLLWEKLTFLSGVVVLNITASKKVCLHEATQIIIEKFTCFIHWAINS
jgi:hypothetical protein